MLHWTLIYGVPTALMLFLWTAFLTRFRGERKLWPAWLAMTGATLPSLMGDWALTHVVWMARRAPTDYKLEKVAMTLGLIGAASAVVWLIRSRHFCSWGALAVAVWISGVWIVILNFSA